MSCKLSIVVPVYRSEKILPQLVSEVRAAAAGRPYDGSFELILVDDGSPDGSWKAISGLAKANPFVKGVSLRKNFGQHSATIAGLHSSTGDIVVIMDDDLQHPPAEIANLYRAVEQGADVCYVRYKHRKHALWKKFGSYINDRVATVLLNKPSGLYLSSFKAMNRGIVSEIIKYDGPYVYLDGLILDVTRSIAVIDIEHQARKEGEGNYDLIRSVSLWLHMATNFSLFPLRLATVLGLSFAALSLPLIGFLVIQKIMHPETAAGWTSLIATILFIGGLQTFCIGIAGEYLGRAYIKINRKPQYCVRETTWTDGPR